MSCCSACAEGKPCSGGSCTIGGTLPAEKPQTRFPFEGSGLDPWGNDGVDDVGGVTLRKLEPCDHIASIYAGLIDAQGEPITATGELNAFMLPREIDRQWRENNARNAGGWRGLMQLGQREFRGGFQYASTDPREFTATNFGHGWDVGASWRSVDGRDKPQAPVVWILYRVLPAAVASLSAGITYRSCKK